MDTEALSLSFDSELDDPEVETDLVLDKIVNRLTEFVRKQYCSYLEKLLVENYKSWCLQRLGKSENPPSDWIKKCVEIYEDNALKSCMILQFYRQAMLRTMAKIRKLTINGKLADKVKNYSEPDNIESENSKKFFNVGTQTKKIIQDYLIDTSFTNIPRIHKNINNVHHSESYSYEELSLDEKLKLFKKRFLSDDMSEDRKRKCTRSPLEHSNQEVKHSNQEALKIKPKIAESEQEISIKPEEMNVKINYVNIEEQLNEIFEPKEDEIAKELDKIFQDKLTELDEIFGDTNIPEDPEIDNILKEIESATLPNYQDYVTKHENKNESYIKHEENKSLILVKTKPESKERHEDILRNSLWPCELHMRKQKLRESLSKIGEEFGMKCHENLKIKFLTLFGEDDEDEFAPYSPTLELDEILLSSCKKRIAPWIVKHLMVPMIEGKISNRILFKAFAKKIAHKIVLEDQYTNEQYIKYTIEHYFLIHDAVTSLEEIQI